MIIPARFARAAIVDVAHLEPNRELGASRHRERDPEGTTDRERLEELDGDDP
jgi:hypothetical protein